MKKKHQKIKSIVELKAVVEFNSYGSKTKDHKAHKQIKQWLSERIRGLYIPLYIEKDSNTQRGTAAWIEDSTSKVKVVR